MQLTTRRLASSFVAAAAALVAAPWEPTHLAWAGGACAG